MALQFSLHWIILFLNLWQKTKNNGLRQWNIKHYIFHFIMFTGTLTRILQHLSAQVSPVSPNRPPHVQWYWYCWILGHQCPVQTCKRCLAMFDHVVQCETSETWRQLVLLSADKQQEQAHLEVLHNIVKHNLQVWSRAAECDDAVPVSGSVWCSTVCMSGPLGPAPAQIFTTININTRGAE